MPVSDATRACLVNIVSVISPDGFNPADLEKQHRSAIPHLSRAGYIKKNPTGDKKYSLTSEGKYYIHFQKLVSK